jgi:tRNA (uracil-5-)-methyltransferase
MHEKDEESGERRRIRVETFPVASELINHLMHHVMTAVRSSHMLRHKLFQANFHTTLSGQAMITLIYHKKLDDAWTQEAKQLRAGLADVPGATTLPHVIGRSRKTRLLLDDGEVEEVLDVPGRGELKYVQVEGAFSQPNGGICRSMLGWAVDVTSGSQDHDLLELYCGNGNFTAAVAPNFRRVMATEVSKSAVAAARRNFESNGLSNVLVARMRSEEFVEAWRSGRKYQRLENTDLKTYDFKTLLVDPPRSGLDDETRLLAREFERIVYISCNPETLRRDVAALRDAFEVQRFAMFDQFPYTHHVECGVYLVKREGIAAVGASSVDEQARGEKRKAEEEAKLEEEG